MFPAGAKSKKVCLRVTFKELDASFEDRLTTALRVCMDEFQSVEFIADPCGKILVTLDPRSIVELIQYEIERKAANGKETDILI